MATSDSKAPFEKEHKVLNEAMSLRASIGTILPLEVALLAQIVVELRAIRNKLGPKRDRRS